MAAQRIHSFLLGWAVCWAGHNCWSLEMAQSMMIGLVSGLLGFIFFLSIFYIQNGFLCFRILRMSSRNLLATSSSSTGCGIRGALEGNGPNSFQLKNEFRENLERKIYMARSSLVNCHKKPDVFTFFFSFWLFTAY